MLAILFIFISIYSKKPYNIRKNSCQNLRIAVIVPCFNEEKLLERKLENINKAIPSKKWEYSIYIIDDGSTDSTLQMANNYKACIERGNLIILRNARNIGKARTLNQCFRNLEEDIIVITDADSLLEKDSFSELVSNFNDPNVGAVCGRIITPGLNGKLILKEEGMYRRFYDRWRQAESVLDSCSVFNGPLMAVRKDLAKRIELDENTYTDDIDLLFKVRRMGYRAIYEPKAVVCEYISSSFSSRFRQEIRRARGLTGVFLKNLTLIGRFDLFGKFIYPISLFHHVFSPVITLFILLLFPYVAPNYLVFFMVLPLLLIIPITRVAIVGYMMRIAALIVGLLIPQRGKWTPIRS
jgi:cellulose synthase/poly-beta-1,6-N-acetylglucosamine synthase-like glycosyltransferase